MKCSWPDAGIAKIACGPEKRADFDELVSGVLCGQPNRDRQRSEQSYSRNKGQRSGFHVASMREGLRGAGSVETTAGEEWVGTAERDNSTAKTTCVKANRTLDAVTDGAFAATPMNLMRDWRAVV